MPVGGLKIFAWYRKLLIRRSERKWQREVTHIKDEFDVRLKGTNSRTAKLQEQIIAIKACILALERTPMAGKGDIDAKKRELAITEHAIRRSRATKMTLLKGYHTKIGAADAKKAHQFLMTMFDPDECAEMFDDLKYDSEQIDVAAEAGAPDSADEYLNVDCDDNKQESQTLLPKRRSGQKRGGVNFDDLQARLLQLPLAPAVEIIEQQPKDKLKRKQIVTL